MKRLFAAVMICSMIGLWPDSSVAKPLKIYILAGQSNMEGHAQTSTFDYIGKDPKTAPLLKEMRNEDGTPTVCQNVWISYFTGWETFGEGHGNLTAGYGARQDPTKDGGKIGPEFTFGIYMHKLTGEPILLIKTAWGGKSLNTDFRPPSAGPYEFAPEQLAQFQQRGRDVEQMKAEKAAATGHYYRLMMEHIKQVLSDVKRVCPAYDEKEGYELAGFVWFQGWNDMCDGTTYPSRNQPGGYALYSDLLAHFIRDVRKDLGAPNMRFVIGVLGVGGPEQQIYFRQAMAAPASMPEFQGNVVAVETAPFWDFEIEQALPKRQQYDRIIDTAHTLTAEGAIDISSQWEGYWEPIDQVQSADRTWRFASVEPRQEQDKLQEYTARRFRDITLPAGLENWYLSEFDDRQWTEGQAPVGKGVWKHGGKTVKNNSPWGDGEFLLMRTTFTLDQVPDYAAYRLGVLARQGFHVYLNGHRIHTYIWWKDEPYYRAIPLTERETQYLKKGPNVLAVYANDQYDQDSPDHYGSVDLVIEGITPANQQKLRRELETIFPLKDRETLEGCSNQGYHYLGSAKIMAQIGKAFAEAMVQ